MIKSIETANKLKFQIKLKFIWEDLYKRLYNKYLSCKT